MSHVYAVRGLRVSSLRFGRDGFKVCGTIVHSARPSPVSLSAGPPRSGIEIASRSVLGSRLDNILLETIYLYTSRSADRMDDLRDSYGYRSYMHRSRETVINIKVQRRQGFTSRCASLRLCPARTSDQVPGRGDHPGPHRNDT